jgi:cyclohexyl-isocyanide hydratase
VHCSFAPKVDESAAKYFPGQDDVEVMKIDPRRIEARVHIAETPRGPMPHVHGTILEDAIRARVPVGSAYEDEVRGTRFCFFAFDGMTLLDLVGVHDPIARIASMGFDETSTRIVAGPAETVHAKDGMRITVDAVLPPLDDVDVLVLAGGPNTRVLQEDERVLAWIRSFPKNRLLATVCTGSLLAAAAGRLAGRRAATHHSARGALAAYGVDVRTDRVVEDGQRITAGGVTSGIDLGLHLVAKLVGAEAARTIAARMEHPQASDGISPA